MRTRSDLHQQQYIEDTKAGGDGDHEITGHDRLGMIVDESVPGLRCWLWARGQDRARPVGSYRAGRNLDAELQEQLIGDACLSPGWILPNHCGDQLTTPAGMRGRPGRDFHFQKSLNALRCQPIRVSGLTMTRALLQSQNRDHTSRLKRAASVRRRGRI
jgi:hypothetical protein